MKKISKLYIALSILLFPLSNIFGHKDHSNKPTMPAIGVIQATVVDSISSKPIEYASVSLVEIEHNELITGGLTDKSGRVSITEIPLGRYAAVIEFIGYKKKEISPIILFPGEGNGIKQDLETVQLSISALNMDGVDVIGDESTFIQTIDKQIFNVGKDLSSSGGTGSDILRKIPSVDVDIDGVVSIAGDANVTILIDGKRSGRTGSGRRGEVENIAASMVEKVEVITNPSAKYDPDGVGGIINIVMKRGALDGFNGNVSLMQGQYNKQNLNGSVNYRTDKWNLFTGSNFRTGDRIGNGIRQFRYDYGYQIDSLFQNTKRTRSPNNLGIRFGGDYYPSSSTTVGYTLDIAEHRELTNEEFDYLVNTRSPELLGVFQTTEHDDGYHIDHVLSYENKFDSDEELLKAYVSASHEIDDVHEYSENETLHNINDSNNKTDALENNDNITISFDYENNYNDRLAFEVGSKITARNFGKDLKYLQNDYSNDYQEDIHATYLVTRYDITERFGLKVGARLEVAETKAVLKGPTTPDSTNILTHLFNIAIDNSPFINDYSKIYPSAFLLYKLTNKQSLQFGYSKKVNRPSRRTLSPFPQSTQDISRIRTGNPFLKPEYSDVMELKFSSNSRKLNLNLSSSYKNTKDVIMWWDRDYERFIETSDDGIPDTTWYEIMTAGNADNSKSTNFSGNIMYRPMPLASIMAWGWGWNSKMSDVGEADFNGTSRGFGFGGRFTLNIPTVARIEISGNGRAKMKITTGTIPANYRIDLGLQKYFLEKSLSVTFKVNDLFQTGKFIIDTENPVLDRGDNLLYTQYMYAERQREQRNASIILSYNFGKQQKKRWDKSNFSGRSGRMGGGGGMDMDY